MPVALEIWLTFSLASFILLVIPGPTIMLVIGYALSHGRKAALYTVAGVALGDFTAILFSMAGLGAMLSASATLFTIVKWLGAGYLIYLGISMWRKIPEGSATVEISRIQPPGLSMAGHAFFVTALNPKGITFFLSFLPQFLDASHPLLPQLVLLGGTFLFLGIINAAFYAVLAGRVGESIRNPALIKGINRLGGAFLVGAGLITATLKRNA